MRSALILAVVLTACEPTFTSTPSPQRMTPAAQPVPCLRLVPESLDFGEVEAGMSGFLQVRITNTTAFVRDLRALPLPPPFRISPLLDQQSVPIASGSTKVAELQFGPIDGLLHLGSVEFQAGADCTVSLPLRGLGSGSVTISPEHLDFGFLPPGAQKSLEFTLTNTRREPVTLSRFGLIGGSTFPAFSSPVPSELVLPPTSVQTFTVTASPPSDDTFLGQLLGATPMGVLQATMQVVGGAPVAQWSATALEVPLASSTTFAERAVGLRNVSTLGRSREAQLRVVPPVPRVEALEGSVDELVVQPSSELFQGLEPGASGELVLLLIPSATGSHRYRVTIFTNDPERPEQVITFHADVQSLPECNWTVTPPSMLGLAPTSPGRSEGTIVFENTGLTSCVVDDLRLSSTTPSTFGYSGDAQVTIPPGGSKAVTVSGPRFPSSPGALSFHVFTTGSQRQSIALQPPP